MYTRWVQFGALSAALRLHSCGDDLDRRPWLWGQQFEKAMHRAFVLRSELFLYLYSASRQCYDHMMPLLRGMYLEYPELEEAYQFPGQYMLGDNILVAPITRAGKGTDLTVRQKIWFPAGEWFHFFTGEKIQGDRVRQLSFAIDEIPIYVKGGSPIPLQPYARRMASATIETLRLRCFPGSAGETVLYEDDGQTEAYTRDECAFTKIHYREEGTTAMIDLRRCEGRYKGQKRRRAYRIELVAGEKAISATVNGKAVSVTYDASLHANIINISPTLIDRALECMVHMS
jgi:alpha-glucosidase (family GH31 glycosyl hydrolase)